jgi:cytochrome c biogenesis protein CcdA
MRRDQSWDLGIALIGGFSLLVLAALPAVLGHPVDWGLVVIAAALALLGIAYAVASPERRQRFELTSAERRRWAPVLLGALLPILIIGLLVGGPLGQGIGFVGSLVAAASVLWLAHRERD